MVCERCGSEIDNSTSICSGCGSVTTRARRSAHQYTSYGQHPQSNFGDDLSQQRGYQPPVFVHPSLDYAPYAQQEQIIHEPGAPGSGYQAAPGYQHNTTSMPLHRGAIFTNKNNSALIAEIIFSLIGLFGIGWIMAGETAIGVILLLCSIFIYWPIMILGTFFTFGLGLLCLGPIAIGGIIVNTLALNAVLNRKASSVFVPHKPQSPGMRPQSGPHQR